ncbi:hypothetical protein HNQ68_001981 [Pseudochrobactrum saccharolyticum]|uniref:Phage tail tape measure protein domain-containing protein n=1 Tax=Pseudochrobactrum saccharolyticum TaxID=354352 RepID=A0A7W8ENG5_9HYPH|nr:phage tail tape measure protein [Pseudochrobactrum saccharolyticum]KAB0538204.1 phage tail tape measure protein [Pseudochrobactrum saccharolyticum]MBB5091440.1 hypothetical protein [Pseudochrobactrum saccharolyticum]
MANLTSILTVRLIDAVTAPARAAANSIRGIGTAVDSTNARRLAIGGAINTMVTDVGKATDRLRRNFNNMTSGLSMPASFLTFFGARSVYDFEKTSNALQAVTNVTDVQRKSIQSYAKELNELFPATNSEIMKGTFELGRAGFKYEQIMGSMKGMLNLALAGDIEIKESADIATNVLTAMRLPMKTVEQASESLTRVNDALAYAASNSNTDVRMMGETFKYVGPMAAAAGMSIEEVSAASMVMARNGIRASEAGVAMRSALVRMVRPTKPMLAALERLNINVNDFVKGGRQISAQDIVSSLAVDGIDATSYAKQIEQVLNDPSLKKSLSKLTEKLTNVIGGDGSVMDKSKLAETITEALTAAGSEVDFFGFIRTLREKGADLGDIARVFDARQGSRLITLLAGDLDKALSDVENGAKGATDRMAKIMMKGIVGDWAAFTASIENLFVMLGESGVLKTASEAIKWAADGLKSLSESNPKLLEFGTYAIMIMAALGPIAIIGGGVISFFLSLVSLMMLATKFGRGALAVAAATMGVTGATAAGAAGTAAASATVAGAATKGTSLFGKVIKGAGVVGTAYTINEILGAIDPEGNLWGLTSGIDAWMKEKTGIDPSKIGASERVAPQVSPEEGRAHDLAEWQARQAAIDTRLSQIEKNTHPSMRDMPNMERENLQAERTMLDQQINDMTPQGDAAGGASAANETMGAFNAAFDVQAAEARAKAVALARELQAILSTTISPTIRPKMDMSAISGVHADTGVE